MSLLLRLMALALALAVYKLWGTSLKTKKCFLFHFRVKINRIFSFTGTLPNLTMEDLLDDFVTLFIAGQETTANVLSFMFLEVGKRPEILEKYIHVNRNI